MFSLMVMLVVLFASISCLFEVINFEKTIAEPYQRVLKYQNDRKEGSRNYVLLEATSGAKHERSDTLITQDDMKKYFPKTFSGRQQIDDQSPNKHLFLADQFTTSVDLSHILDTFYQTCLVRGVASGNGQFDETIVGCMTNAAPEDIFKYNTRLKNGVDSYKHDLECLINATSEQYMNNSLVQEGRSWLIEYIRRSKSKTNEKNVGSSPKFDEEIFPDNVRAFPCFFEAVYLFSSDLENLGDGSQSKKSVYRIKLETSNFPEPPPVNEAPERSDQNLQTRLQKIFRRASSLGQKVGSGIRDGAVDAGQKIKGSASNVGQAVHTESRKFTGTVGRESKKFADTVGRESRKFADTTVREGKKVADAVGKDGKVLAENAGKDGVGILAHLFHIGGRKPTTRKGSIARRGSNGRSTLKELQDDDLFNCLLTAISAVNIPGQVVGSVSSLGRAVTGRWSKLRLNFFSKSKSQGGPSPSKSRSTRGDPQKSQSLSFKDVVDGTMMERLFEEVKKCLKFFEHDEKGNLRLNQKYLAGTAEDMLQFYPPAALALGTAQAITGNVRLKKGKSGSNLTDFDIDAEGLLRDLGMAIVKATPVGRGMVKLGESINKVSSLAQGIAAMQPKRQ